MRHKFLLALLTPLFALPALAQSFTYTYEGQTLNYTVSDETAKTCYVSYNRSGVSGDVIIPESVIYNGNTYSVTSIGSNAFTYCDGLISITLPNSISTIPLRVFDTCSSLIKILVDSRNQYYSSVDGILFNKNASEIVLYPRGLQGDYSIPESVISVGELAFSYCKGLTTVTIPNSVTSISNYAFYDCDGLTTVTIPNSVTSVGSYAFSGCDGLTTVTIPNSVTEIGYYAFSSCKGLESVTIPESTTSFHSTVLEACNSLTEILVDSRNQSYSSIDGVLFNKDATEIILYPGGLQGAYSIPKSVVSIGGRTFYNHRGLTTVIIPSSVTTIGDDAFMNSSLSNVAIPNSVTSIGQDAFCGCSGLTSVIIPNSVTSVGYYAFSGCTGLKYVTIPKSVTSINPRTFERCSSLTSVTIPNSVKSIGESAFDKCSGLTSVTIGNSVTEIGKYAFRGCSDLTTVIIPNSVTKIGDMAFFECKGLTSVTIPNSITEIRSAAFEGCINITEVNYNASRPINNPYNIFYSDTYNTATLYVAVGGLGTARSTYPWNKFKDIREKEFEEPAEEALPCEVIVKLPGGNLHLAEEHAGTTVRLTADDGFEFHSATLNGEDVSYLVGEHGHFTVPNVDQPAVLNVVFKQSENQETGINAASLEDEVRVAVHGKRVSVSGKDAETKVRAYDLRGVLLNETYDSEFSLDYSGVVILRIGAATFKFAI